MGARRPWSRGPPSRPRCGSRGSVQPARDDGSGVQLGAELRRDGDPSLVVHRVPVLAGEHQSGFPCRCGRGRRCGAALTMRPRAAGGGGEAGSSPAGRPGRYVPHFSPLRATSGHRSASTAPVNAVSAHGDARVALVQPGVEGPRRPLRRASWRDGPPAADAGRVRIASPAAWEPTQPRAGSAPRGRVRPAASALRSVAMRSDRGHRRPAPAAGRGRDPQLLAGLEAGRLRPGVHGPHPLERDAEVVGDAREVVAGADGRSSSRPCPGRPSAAR